MTWLSDICHLLRTTKAKQWYTDLARFEYDETDEMNEVGVISYCVLGVLLCNKKQIKTAKDYKNNDKFYDSILRRYKVPIWARHISYIDGNVIVGAEVNLKESNFYSYGLAKLMWVLNDEYKLSFPQIADFLETTFEDCV